MKHVFIFEGPDGVGKTTTAKALAKDIGAAYVHHGPYLDIADGDVLAETYAISMLPALANERHIVLDRSWISEVPYANAFRGGVDRLGDGRRARLEDAIRKATIPRVVHCTAPLTVVLDHYRARKGDEYLETEVQMRDVWRWFCFNFATSLPYVSICLLNTTIDTNVETLRGDAVP